MVVPDAGVCMVGGIIAKVLCVWPYTGTNLPCVGGIFVISGSFPIWWPFLHLLCCYKYLPVLVFYWLVLALVVVDHVESQKLMHTGLLQLCTDVGLWHHTPFVSCYLFVFLSFCLVLLLSFCLCLSMHSFVYAGLMITCPIMYRCRVMLLCNWLV